MESWTEVLFEEKQKEAKFILLMQDFFLLIDHRKGILVVDSCS